MLTMTRGITIEPPTWVWGLPLSPITRAQAVDAAIALVERGEPSFFITANTHHAMLGDKSPELRVAMTKAAFVAADGAPLVRASRGAATPLPERVAGSDLIFDLSERAAALGLRVSLLGGEPGVAEEAARRLTSCYRGLQIVGIESPPFRDLSAEEHEAMLDRIRRPRPHLLFVAFGSPKGNSGSRATSRRSASRSASRSARGSISPPEGSHALRDGSSSPASNGPIECGLSPPGSAHATPAMLGSFSRAFGSTSSAAAHPVHPRWLTLLPRNDTQPPGAFPSRSESRPGALIHPDQAPTPRSDGWLSLEQLRCWSSSSTIGPPTW